MSKRLFNPYIGFHRDGAPSINDENGNEITKPLNWSSNKPLYALRRNIAEVIYEYMRDKINKDLDILTYNRAYSMQTLYKDIIRLSINANDEARPEPFLNTVKGLVCDAARQQEAISLSNHKDQYINPKSPTSYFKSNAIETLKLAGQHINMTRAYCGLQEIDVFEEVPAVRLPESQVWSSCNIL